MNHDRLVSISGAWLEGESVHVEEIYAGPDVADATEWVINRAGRRIPVIIDSMSPAAAMIAPLKVRRCKVITSTAPDMAKACGLFVDKITAGQVTHSGQEALKVALLGAKKRPIGTAGGWGFDRSDPEIDISPLVAATLAVFGCSSAKRRTSEAVFV